MVVYMLKKIQRGGNIKVGCCVTEGFHEREAKA
jgi:hypothetical protein